MLTYLGLCGLVELFLLVTFTFASTNHESPPRPHNSGRHRRMFQREPNWVERRQGMRIPVPVLGDSSQSIESLEESLVENKVSVNHRWEATEKRSPPTYFTLLYERLVNSVSRGQGYEYESHRELAHQILLRTILPNQIIHEDFGLTNLIFNMSFLDVGIFNSAQLIFTMKKEVEMVLDASHVTLHVKFQNQQEKQTQRIWNDTQFYAFDFTDFLNATVNAPQTEKDVDNVVVEQNGSLVLEVLVFRNNRRKQIPMDLIFDVMNNAPFLLLRYHPLPTSGKRNLNSMDNGSNPKSRDKRFLTNDNEVFSTAETSVITQLKRERQVPNRASLNNGQSHPPASIVPTTPEICRKHHWDVRPGDIGLDEIIAPNSLDLGFCGGDCPFPLLNDVFNFTLHSYFVDRHRILKSFETPHTLPNSSCVAVSYKPLMVVEAAASGQVVLVHQNGLVESCGCRY